MKLKERAGLFLLGLFVAVVGPLCPGRMTAALRDGFNKL